MNNYEAVYLVNMSAVYMPIIQQRNIAFHKTPLNNEEHWLLEGKNKISSKNEISQHKESYFDLP